MEEGGKENVSARLGAVENQALDDGRFSAPNDRRQGALEQLGEGCTEGRGLRRHLPGPGDNRTQNGAAKRLTSECRGDPRIQMKERFRC